MENLYILKVIRNATIILAIVFFVSLLAYPKNFIKLNCCMLCIPSHVIDLLYVISWSIWSYYTESQLLSTAANTACVNYFSHWPQCPRGKKDITDDHYHCMIWLRELPQWPQTQINFLTDRLDAGLALQFFSLCSTNATNCIKRHMVIVQNGYFCDVGIRIYICGLRSTGPSLV